MSTKSYSRVWQGSLPLSELGRRDPLLLRLMPRSMLIPAALLAIVYDPGKLGSWLAFCFNSLWVLASWFTIPLPTIIYHFYLPSSPLRLFSRNSGYWRGQAHLMYPLAISGFIFLTWPSPWFTFMIPWTAFINYMFGFFVCLLFFIEKYIKKNALIIST